MKVGLAGIKTTEFPPANKDSEYQYAQRAKKFLADLVLNEIVTIKAYGLDRFDHVLGEIFLNGKNINLEMVRAGLVEICRGNPPDGFNVIPYEEAEAEAKKAHRGIWSSRGNNTSIKN